MTLDDARMILDAEDHHELVSLLLGWAEDDDRLRERILLLAARRTGPDALIAAAQQAFKKAVRIRDFVHYREARSWARGVDDAIDTIDALFHDGPAAAAVELCESALEALDKASGGIDDSDGYLSTLRDRLQGIHLRACQKAKPDPETLARRLFHFEMHSELDIFAGAAETYASILGSRGSKEYRRLAETEWAKFPPLQPGQDRLAESGRYRITHIMESIARASGDIEARVAVLSRDLSHPYDYLRIATVYRDARHYSQALLWAESGLKAFPAGADSRLREFAAEEYHRLRRHDDAMKLIWAEFSERTCLQTYEMLERHARKTGSWNEWRERALESIRKWERPRARRDDSLLVEILLHDGDYEAAWRQAQAGGCSDWLWLRLAESREKSHPADAAPIYLRLAEEALHRASDPSYEQPAGLLVKAAASMRRLNRSDEFIRALDSIRMKHKRKRNFIKLLDKKQRSLHGR